MTTHADRPVAPGDISPVAPGDISPVAPGDISPVAQLGGVPPKGDSRAIALQYTDDLPAPLVVASGRGAIADAIRRIARESGVPVVSDAALADSLIELDVGSLIPESLYAVVAELLVFVRDLRS